MTFQIIEIDSGREKTSGCLGHTESFPSDILKKVLDSIYTGRLARTRSASKHHSMKSLVI